MSKFTWDKWNYDCDGETELAIEHFSYGISHDIYSEPVTTYARLAVEALMEKQERDKGCDGCGLIYAIHAESYGIEDLDCANEPIDNKFCPMCGVRLPVNAGTIGGEIVKHAMREVEK